MADDNWRVANPGGRFRVVVTRELPGRRWLELLEKAGCRIEVYTRDEVLDRGRLLRAIGARCDGVIGQLTESWCEELFCALRTAGGKVYSNCAVGYDNVDVAAATRCRIPVGNTPGVLTETTAEMAVALTLCAARRLGEAERYMRAGLYKGWSPTLFLGTLLKGKTVGVIGAGRIGGAYGRMMVEGFKMNLVYFGPHAKPELESWGRDYAGFLHSRGEEPVTVRRAESVEELLGCADCVSIHTSLSPSTRHLIDAGRLRLMKPDALLINTSRGPVIDEAALVDHCRRNPDFRAALDVFENEPAMAPGLSELDNVVVVPHVASATRWTREGMASLAAANVAAMINGWPVWRQPQVLPFLQGEAPRAAPSIINAAALGLTD